MADTAITCPTCQHSFDLPQVPSSGRVECPRCRAKLTISTRLKPPDEPLLIPLASSSGRNMAICRDCGTQVSREARACPKCGRVFHKQSPWLTVVVVAIVAVPMVLVGSVFLTILGLVLGSNSSPPPSATAPDRTSIDPIPVVMPPDVAALPLEKRRMVYQMYHMAAEGTWDIWFKSQAIEERRVWESKPAAVRAEEKAAWREINAVPIYRFLTPFLVNADPPIYLTPDGLSAIVREGRSQHWPEHP